jgi:hypothetical protein
VDRSRPPGRRWRSKMAPAAALRAAPDYHRSGTLSSAPGKGEHFDEHCNNDHPTE